IGEDDDDKECGYCDCRGMEGRGAETRRRSQLLLLAGRGGLRAQIGGLRKLARRLERLARRSLMAQLAGTSLSAAGALAAIVGLGLGLGPATLGASLVAAGLCVATAGGAVAVTSDFALLRRRRRALRHVCEIAARCQDQLREVLGGLVALAGGDPATRPPGRLALDRTVYVLVLLGSQGPLVPRPAKGAANISQAVLRAKVQKMADALEACAGALDAFNQYLEDRTRHGKWPFTHQDGPTPQEWEERQAPWCLHGDGESPW
ncbi:apolipoprotein L domain-containing protein 1, partial [Tachyglossus aculeatus]|uniref:apolipoprotein L domain-containing protein 1 n=1 Tax=Tachyglossus aculeatus TaxID=9261 RepID=UPI0018F62568